MSAAPLAGVREKILRAAEHLDAFTAEVDTYAASGPYSIVRAFEDHIPEQSSRPGLTWRARIDPPAPTLRLGILAGDVVHNLRSALDHLAWAVVLQNGGEPSESYPATSFPILPNPLPSAGSSPKTLTFRAKSGAASAAAETILEMLQPYNSGQDLRTHPLWLLNQLWNIDKHRTLNVMTIDLGRIVMRFPDGRTAHATRRDVDDGTMVIWLLSEHPDFDADTQAQAEFSPSIAFRDAPGLGLDPFVPAPDLLAQLLRFTRDVVVQRFAKACFGAELTF